MRKNKFDRKKLNLFTVYEISGYNSDNLVNILKNKGITLTDIKKKDNKTMTFAVNYADNEKFFAITHDLCYNIKKVGEKGRLRFLPKLFRNIGFIIGALVFVILSVVADDYVLSIDYYGSGSVYAREITTFLKTRNVGRFSRFSQIDLPALSDEIAAASDKISFAECAKSGNRLKIDLALAAEPVKTLDGDKENLVSDVDGVIEFVKVYRGTALKNAGDRVTVGETVCGGYAEIKDIVVKVGVIATVSVKAEFFYVYESEKDGEEDIAETFAEIAFRSGEIISVGTDKTLRSDGIYEYKVKIIYRRLLYG